MGKIDLTKIYKTYFTAKTFPEIVDIEAARYISILGKGDPSSEAFDGYSVALSGGLCHQIRLQVCWQRLYGIEIGRSMVVRRAKIRQPVPCPKPRKKCPAASGNTGCLSECPISWTKNGRLSGRFRRLEKENARRRAGAFF